MKTSYRFKSKLSPLWLLFATVSLFAANEPGSAPHWQKVVTTANYYSAQGDYATAERHLNQALVRAGGNPLHRAITLNNLGSVLQDQGRFLEAGNAYREALGLFEKTVGPKHALVGPVLNNLGSLHRALNQLSKAELYLRRSLEIRRKEGQSFPKAEALNNLAQVYYDQGNFGSAAPMLRESISLLEGRYGPEHPLPWQVRTNLALVLAELGQADRGVRMLAASVKSLQRILGPAHPELIRPLLSLANLRTRAGHYDAAEARLLSSLAIALKTHGVSHPITGQILFEYGEVLRETGRTKEGKHLQRHGKAVLLRHNRQNFLNHSVDVADFTDR